MAGGEAVRDRAGGFMQEVAGHGARWSLLQSSEETGPSSTAAFPRVRISLIKGE